MAEDCLQVCEYAQELENVFAYQEIPIGHEEHFRQGAVRFIADLVNRCEGLTVSNICPVASALLADEDRKKE